MTNKKLGDLSNEEIGALVRAYRAGKTIEAFDIFQGWQKCIFAPGWDLGTAYRIAPEPIRQAVIPWDIFTDDVVAVAMDGDGDWGSYTQRPECGFQYWQDGRDCILINHIKFDRGNEPDWRNTLQMRPGYEVK